MLSEGDIYHIEKLFQAFGPSEIIYSRSRKKEFERLFGTDHYTYTLEEWIFTDDYGRDKLLDHFDVQNLKGFGVESQELGITAAGGIIHYVQAMENNNLQHIGSIRRIGLDDYVWLDKFTIKNLELLHPQHLTGVALIDVLDMTISPMGSRLLKKWVVLPLVQKKRIDERLDMVEYLFENHNDRDDLADSIKRIGDLERLASKVAMSKINPREVNQLKIALEAIDPIKFLLANVDNQTLQHLSDQLNPCVKLIDRIAETLEVEAPVNVSKGNVIKAKASAELDELKDIVVNAQAHLLALQQKEVERTGISNLKVGFNNVFGYYLEVTNRYKNQDLIPENWVRKQTLTNAERYITEDLKVLETKILQAEEKIGSLEQEIFNDLVQFIVGYIPEIQRNAFLIAKLDCVLSFSVLAMKNNYVRPEITEGLTIDIKEGRHPVIEKQLPHDKTYVPNDVYLDNEEEQILMITGPNMSGKSAVLRQTALICVMAQMGCFVPAVSAEIGLLDKIFTRVGASDNISSGESTFMVEMNETSSIMNNITNRSLILLDEIGRGTSTYDGISIAWALAEFLHNQPNLRAKTLFATHYHELNELASKYPRINNYHISTKEVGKKVIFLRKMVKGGSRHSFGIHVARMAGMPRAIVERAAAILKELEKKHIDSDSDQINENLRQLDAEAYQLNIFETVDETAGRLKEELLDVDLNTMTPIECMLKLKTLISILEESD